MSSIDLNEDELALPGKILTDSLNIMEYIYHLVKVGARYQSTIEVKSHEISLKPNLDAKTKELLCRWQRLDMPVTKKPVRALLLYSS